MKSFADWTDEIRALMNPPKPMVDRCNWTHDELSFYEGDQWPETIGIDPKWAEELRKPIDFSRYLKDMAPAPLAPYQEAIVAEFCKRWEEAVGGSISGLDPMRQIPRLSIGMGRRTGKSWLTQQMMEALAKHGESMYECTPTGRIKPISTNEMLKRGIIQTPRGTKRVGDYCCEGKYKRDGNTVTFTSVVYPEDEL